jgi:hypothetical protein
MWARVSHGWLSALVAAALVAGCGGGDGEKASGGADAPPKQALPGAPRAAESPKQAGARLADAVRSGDCGSPEKLFLAADAISEDLCQKLLPALAPADPLSFNVYGTGAVMRNAKGGDTILALDKSGRFKFVTTFGPGQPEVPPKYAAQAMEDAVTALRNDNCEALVAISLTYNGAEGEKFCALGPVRELRGSLSSDFQAEPKLLGGNGMFAFAGIATKRGYFTLLFASNRGDTYLFVTSARA